MNNILFFNISSDQIHLSYQEEELFLERNGVENVLGKVLVERWRKYQFKKVYIVNGPGGFTNLRVGSLCMNLLNALVGDQIDFYSVSKIELYQYAYGQGWMPKQGVIYIGQKKNIWLWDFERKEKVWQMNFDQLKQYLEENTINKEDVFLDVVYDYNYYPEDFRTFTHNQYSVLKELIHKYVEEKEVKGTPSIEAKYMIDPIITPSKK